MLNGFLRELRHEGGCWCSVSAVYAPWACWVLYGHMCTILTQNHKKWAPICPCDLAADRQCSVAVTSSHVWLQLTGLFILITMKPNQNFHCPVQSLTLNRTLIVLVMSLCGPLCTVVPISMLPLLLLWTSTPVRTRSHTSIWYCPIWCIQQAIFRRQQRYSMVYLKKNRKRCNNLQTKPTTI